MPIFRIEVLEENSKKNQKNEKNEGPCIGVEEFLDKIGVLGLNPIPDSQKCAKKGSCRHLILPGTSWIKCALEKKLIAERRKVVQGIF